MRAKHEAENGPRAARIRGPADSHAALFALAMHIDTDEANAANVQTGTQGYIEGIQSEA